MDKYIGKMLDNRYEILEIIGVGGMAVVYKARCHRLNRLVAVKILKDEYAQDAEFRRRFHAESQAVAMLSHPNIVAVFDVSRSAEVEYIVMELIDGISLKQYMQKKGTLNWREALHFVTQIVKALSHAHSRGIIHRDIKPHNIMILRDGSVKVADFGIARFASKQNTLTQEALGSVHYISPEQARGSHIDARSDLYSAGVVLYEMLTARLPYEGDSPVSVAIQHINSVPLSPKEIDQDIPDALEMITMKAMAAQLSRRYSSAEVMLRDLEEFRKNPSISFDYDLTDLRPPEDGPDEPTRPLTGGQPRPVVPAGKTGKDDRRRIQQETVREELYETKKSSSKIAILSGVLGVLLFLSVVVFIAFRMVSNLINPGEVEMVEVPNFVGKTFDLAVFSQEYPDLVFDTVFENHEIYGKNTIIKQGTQSKREVPAGSSVELTISLGPEEFSLPDFINKDSRAVQVELNKLGLRFDPQNTTYEKSETIPKDYIIRTIPEAFSLVAKGDSIELVISQGPDVQLVNMPGLIGKTEADALSMLHLLDLTMGQVVREANEAPAGEVIGQSVVKGAQVEEKTVVDLVVSLGMPSPSPSPSPSPTDSPSPSPNGSGELITVHKDIRLPATAGSTLVTVYVSGLEYYRGTVNNADEYKPIDIVGMEGSIIEVYFDGVLMFTEELRAG